MPLPFSSSVGNGLSKQWNSNKMVLVDFVKGVLHNTYIKLIYSPNVDP